MKYILLLLFCSGCVTTEGAEVVNFVQYQIAKSLIDLSRDEAKKEFKRDSSMSYDTYMEKRQQYKINRPRGTMFQISDLYLDASGRIKYRGSKEQKILEEYGVSSRSFFKSFNVSLSTARIKLSAKFNKYFEIEYKQHFDSDWKAIIEFGFDF